MNTAEVRKLIEEYNAAVRELRDIESEIARQAVRGNLPNGAATMEYDMAFLKVERLGRKAI